MCIIIAKPFGVDLPTLEILENCFTSNRDGIGFAFNKTGDKPVISKGFANVKKLTRMIDTFNIGKGHNLLIHFRFATHGMKDQGNCHPFPLVHNFEDMRRLHCACDTAITHNGVFGGLPASDKYSDTMKFISGVLSSPEIINNIESPAVKELVKGYCGHSSKLAFLRAGGLTTIGGFEEDKGIYYSNTQYKPWITRSYGNTTQYCQEHQVWDNCHKDRNGQEWCYSHKRYDHCEYCLDHKTMDTCEYEKEQVSKALTFQELICDYCGVKGNDVSNAVTYDSCSKASLCDSCHALFMAGEC